MSWVWCAPADVTGMTCEVCTSRCHGYDMRSVYQQISWVWQVHSVNHQMSWVWCA